MPTIRVAGHDDDAHPCCAECDELSPEARSYDAAQAIRDGRMSAYRGELDWQENHARLSNGAKLSLAAAACAGLAGFGWAAWSAVQ